MPQSRLEHSFLGMSASPFDDADMPRKLCSRRFCGIRRLQAMVPPSSKMKMRLIPGGCTDVLLTKTKRQRPGRDDARGGSLYQKKVVLLLGLRDELTYLLGTEKKMLDLAGQNAICCDPCRWVK